MARKEQSKHKEVSIVLAVFLSFWTWLYTAEKDWWKFVVGLVIGIGAAVLIVYLNMESLFAINYAVWIWAIVDVSINKDEWYRSYFKRQPKMPAAVPRKLQGSRYFAPDVGCRLWMAKITAGIAENQRSKVTIIVDAVAYLSRIHSPLSFAGPVAGL